MTEKETFRLKVGLAEMLKGGVIMDVTNVDQSKIAEEAGALAVMALERIPSDIRAHGGGGAKLPPRLVPEVPAAGFSSPVAPWPVPALPPAPAAPGPGR